MWSRLLACIFPPDIVFSLFTVIIPVLLYYPDFFREHGESVEPANSERLSE